MARPLDTSEEAWKIVEDGLRRMDEEDFTGPHAESHELTGNVVDAGGPHARPTTWAHSTIGDPCDEPVRGLT